MVGNELPTLHGSLTGVAKLAILPEWDYQISMGV
jgi:hypothetical protein